MFDDIAPRYDFLNRLLSWGQDLKWRREIGRYLPAKSNLHLLDAATGTADVLLQLIPAYSKIGSACGIDMAEKMLEIGRRKIEEKGLPGRIELKAGDANQIPFPALTFDVATIAFGIRNMADPKKVMSEMFRVLKKDGRALILEFSLPSNPCIRAIHLFYLRWAVPAVGHLFSGHFRAYRYLNRTIESFPFGENFLEILKKTGFKNLESHSLMCGAATIYQGDRP